MIGRKIRDKRRKLHMTQTDLADAIGVSTSAVSQYEHGTREPNIELLIKILDTLKMTSKELLGR